MSNVFFILDFYCDKILQLSVRSISGWHIFLGVLVKKSIVAALMVLGMSFMALGDTFVDKETNLMWQDDEDTKTFRGNWQEAKDYCENLTLAGYSDWKLPDKDTLAFFYQKKPYLTNVNDYVYWSSSSVVGDSNFPNFAWDVHFSYGLYPSDKGNYEYVRCVRGSKHWYNF